MQGIISSTDGVTAQVDLGGSTVPATLLVHTAALGVGARVLLDGMRTQTGGATLVVVGGLTSGSGGGFAYGPELLSNPSFEFGPSGFWNLPSNWTIEWDYTTGDPQPASWVDTPGAAHGGVGFTRVDITPGITVAHDLNLLPEVPITVDAGTVLRGQTWLKASTTGQGLVTTLRAYTANTPANCWAFGTGRSQFDLATVSDPGSAYQLLEGTYTVPAGHTCTRLVHRTVAPLGASVVASWDDSSLKQRF